MTTPYIFRNVYKFLPVFNLVVGTSAFAFQLNCLYPWHLELDESFKKLREQRNAENIEKLEKLDNINQRLSNMEKNLYTVKSRMSRLL